MLLNALYGAPDMKVHVYLAEEGLLGFQLNWLNMQ